MLRIYKTDLETEEFTKVDVIEKGTWINMIDPTEEEIEYVCKKTNIESDFLLYPLDIEERARIDAEEDVKLIIVDIPIHEEEALTLYSTIPLGMIVVRDDYFITVCLKETPILIGFEYGKIKTFLTYKKTRFVLQLLYKISQHYLLCLKHINKETDKAEQELNESMRNKELIKLLNIEKSLVYFTTSLKSNELIMERIMKGKTVKMYEEDEDILEDAIIENRQAIEMSVIYSNILSGTMDAYASIISNNLNIVMKFLASITIVLSLPTVVASLFGMNVIVPLAEHRYGFSIVIGITILISLLTLVWLKRKKML